MFAFEVIIEQKRNADCKGNVAYLLINEVIGSALLKASASKGFLNGHRGYIISPVQVRL